MADSERREHLFLVVDSMVEIHSKWAESDTPHITETFETAIDELLEVFELGSIPGDCRELTHRVSTMGEHWYAWKAKVELAGAINPMPGDGFWDALESVEDGRRAAEPKRAAVLEPIKELTSQKVPDRQICLIYGWTDPDGSPQFYKLQEERAEPGTHIGKDFVAPQEKERRQKDARAKAIIDRIRKARRSKVEQLSTPAPEPLADLVAQGVSAEQIGQLKHLTVQQVFAACDEQEIDRPEENYGGLEAYRSLHEGELSEPVAKSIEAGQRALAEQSSSESMESVESMEPLESMGNNAVPSGLTLEQEIIFYHQQDMTPSAIAVAVSTEDETVTPQKVGKIIARFNREPEAFSMNAIEAE